MFDPLSWAIGFSLTTGIKSLTSIFTNKTLDSEIRETAIKWAEKLADNRAIQPASLFPRLIDQDNLLQRPALSTLRKRLLNQRIPTLTEWHQALIEQWQSIANNVGKDPQPFFLLSENEARSELRALAIAIVGVCEKNDPLFKGTVLDHLQEILQVLQNKKAIDLPSPFVWTDKSTLKELALTIEDEIATEVAVILINKESSTIHTWMRLPGENVTESKISILRISYLVCRIPQVEFIEIGIFNNEDMRGTDGRGPVGLMKIRVSLSNVREIELNKTSPPNFWKCAQSFILQDDNELSQKWIEIPFRDFEEHQ